VKLSATGAKDEQPQRYDSYRKIHSQARSLKPSRALNDIDRSGDTGQALFSLGSAALIAWMGKRSATASKTSVSRQLLTFGGVLPSYGLTSTGVTVVCDPSA
jgi:hypothetical protein